MKLRWDIVLWAVGIVFMAGMAYSGWRYETRITVLETQYEILDKKLDRILDILKPYELAAQAIKDA